MVILIVIEPVLKTFEYHFMSLYISIYWYILRQHLNLLLV